MSSYLSASRELFDELENFLVMNEEDRYSAYQIIKDYLENFEQLIADKSYDEGHDVGYDIGYDVGYDEGLYSEGDF